MLLAVGLSVGACFLALPVFRVETPRVEGASLVAEGAIVEVSGLVGRSVFFVDPREVEREVEDLRPIESASVRVVWPNEVTISVSERRPFAAWRSGTSTFLVSADGIVLAESQSQPPDLIIRDVDERRVFVGGQVESEILDQVAQIQRAILEGGAGLIVGGVCELSSVEGLVVSVRLTGSSAKPQRVVFGRGPGLSQKLDAWRLIEPELASGKLKAEQIDLRVPDRPYLR
jgi:hypothetical protein